MIEIPEDFFTVLTGKYQTLYYRVIGTIYDRTNGPFADYNVHLGKTQISQMIQSVLSDIETDKRPAKELSVATSMIFKSLSECGWLENYTDTQSLKQAYKLTEFALPIAQTLFSDQHQIHVAAQHASSVRSHLQTFVRGVHESRIDINDLMSAARFSSFIVNDLNSMIHEIGHCRKVMIKMMAEKNADLGEAAKAFFDFMEVRFSGGIALSFSRDSVERYKHDIVSEVQTVYQLDDQTKADIEESLRKYYGHLKEKARDRHQGSILLWSLDMIETQLENATVIKLPELRNEISTLTERATLALRDIVAINAQKKENDVFRLMANIKRLPDTSVEKVLSEGESIFGMIQPSFHNPSHVKISGESRHKFSDMSLTNQTQSDEEKLKNEAWSEVFDVSNDKLNANFNQRQKEGLVSLDSVVIDSYQDFLFSLQLEKLASLSQVEHGFHCEEADDVVDNGYFSSKNIRIRKQQ